MAGNLGVRHSDLDHGRVTVNGVETGLYMQQLDISNRGAYFSVTLRAVTGGELPDVLKDLGRDFDLSFRISGDEEYSGRFMLADMNTSMGPLSHEFVFRGTGITRAGIELVPEPEPPKPEPNRWELIQ